MNQCLSLEHRIALAQQRLHARHHDLSRHRLQLKIRVLGELRASPVTVAAGVALLAWGWYTLRKRAHR